MQDPLFDKLNYRVATRAYTTAFLAVFLGVAVLMDGDSNGVYVIALGICTAILGRRLDKTVERKPDD